MYQFDWSAVSEYFPTMMRGLAVTIEVSVIAEAVAIMLGLFFALCRLSGFAPIRLFAVAYIDFLRGVPILVILLWTYYGLPILLKVNLTAMQAGIIGLGCSYAAYLAEIFRSGIQAVPGGQREAGRTLGLSRWHITMYVVLPQAFRIIVPPLGNTMISMLKDSSLVSIVAVDEMMRLTQVAAAETYRPLELYAAAAVYYYLMTLVTARAINLIERRLSRLPDSTTRA